MPQVGTHRGRQREVLRGSRGVPAAGEGQAKPEMCVIVTRARLHDPPETVGCRSVPAGVELCPAQGLQNAACPGLGRRSAFEQLGGCRRTAPAEQVEPAAVPGVGVTVRDRRAGIGAAIFLVVGIVAAARCF